jgi:UDP-glucose 4-epimerase
MPQRVTMNQREGARVVVTGGAGFIGRRVVKQLAEAGNQVLAIDNLSIGRPLPPPAGNVRAAQADVREGEAIERLFESFLPNVVIHLAAVHHIPTCEKRRSHATDVNITGTEVVLAAAEKTKVGMLVLASSGAVYDWSAGPLREDSSPLGAHDHYTLTKLTNERQVAFWAERTGGLARIARLFNTIGHDDPNGHLIPDILAQIPNGAAEPTVLLGNTEPKRDYLHADDSATGLVALMSDIRLERRVEVYNICSGIEYSVSDLVNEIAELRGIRIHIQTDPDRVRTRDRLHQLGSLEKTQELLGWRPRLSFRNALLATLKGGCRDGVTFSL